MAKCEFEYGWFPDKKCIHNGEIFVKDPKTDGESYTKFEAEPFYKAY